MGYLADAWLEEEFAALSELDDYEYAAMVSFLGTRESHEKNRKIKRLGFRELGLCSVETLLF